MTADEVQIHRYALKPRAERLSPRSGRAEFEGVLIQVEGGFGCIHPWPELGDAPLDQQLLALAEGGRTPLTKRALRCCRFDSQARGVGQNLFEGLRIPRSHFSLPEGVFSAPAGFSSVKFKAASAEEALERIRNLAPDLRVRVDFNEALSPAELIDFWENLGEFRDRIEFIEDPVRFEASIWNGMSEALRHVIAVDRAAGEVESGPAYRVVKPAIDDPAEQESLAERFDQRLVFTSYLDHPVGQLFAAFEAANAFKRNPSRLAECGLVTHHLFDETDPFVAALGPATPDLNPPPGLGLGFDDLLHDLPWIPLTTAISSC